MMKRTNKRILSLVLSVLMLLSLLPAGMLAGAADAMNAGNTVYVDQANGSDTNDGTEASPVQTIEKAVELLEAGDVTADGYIYLLGDYSAVYRGTDGKGAFGSNVDYLPVHTRHIIVTGDAEEKPTWTMQIAVPATSATLYDRHVPGSAYMRNNGPVTLDAVAIHATVDKTNLMSSMPEDINYIFPDAHETFAGKTFVIKEGEPFYKFYALADENGDGVLEDVTGDRDTAEEQIILPVRINDIRWTINDAFTATANFGLTYDDAVDPDRKDATLPYTGNNGANITQVYTVLAKSASLYANVKWGNIMVASGAYGLPTIKDDIVLTLGNRMTNTVIYSPAASVPASVNVTYVIEGASQELSKCFDTAANIKCDFTIVVKASNVSLQTSGLTSSTPTGGGSYNLVVENPGTNMKDALLQKGFASLYLKDIDGSYAFDFSKIAEKVGYEIIRIDEGDSLDLNDVDLAKGFELDVVKAGDTFANDSTVVLTKASDASFEKISLTDELDAIGSLVNNDGTVSFVLDRATVAFQKGDTDEAITLPGDASIAVTRGFAAPAPATTTLADGRKFSGWVDEEDNLYKAGDIIYMEEAAAITLTATWGIAMSFVTGFEAEGIVKDDFFYTPGERFVLPGDLRGTVVTDGDEELTFFGWNIGGKFYDAGDGFVVGNTSATATAVWVPAISIDAVNGDDATADGTTAKPYKTFLAAYAAAKAVEGDAVAIVLLSDVSVTAAAETDFYINSSAILNAIGKTVLFTAADSATSLVFDVLEATYIKVYDSLMFDHITFKTISSKYSYTRLLPAKDLYFGQSFTYSEAGDYDAMGLDGMYQTAIDVSYKIYNGAFNFLYTGTSTSSIMTKLTTVNVYLGTGEETSKPSIPSLIPGTWKNLTSTRIEMRSGSVPNAVIGCVYGTARGTGSQPTGELTYVVYNGMSAKFSDASSSAKPEIADYCVNLNRTLIFDGYKGEVSYTHYTNSAGVVNGIDNISFVNGANVTLKDNDVVIKGTADKVGSAYVEEGSSYSGKVVKGVYLSQDTENFVTLSATAGKLIAWNGEEWQTCYNLTYDSGLGSAIAGSYMGVNGTRFVLSDALRGEVVTDGGKELTFFGWSIDGKFYDAGDGYVMGDGDATAVAVYVPAIFVDPTYAGGDSNGTTAKPYTTVSAAYAALQALFADDADAQGGAVYLLSDATFQAEASSVFDVINNIPRLVDAGKPVLFTAKDKDVTLTFYTVTYNVAMYLYGEVKFDNVTACFKNDTNYVRIKPVKDIYCGPQFATVAAPKGAAYVDANAHTQLEYNFKLYGGDFSLVQLGSDSITNAQSEFNFYFGTGDSDSKPSLAHLVLSANANSVSLHMNLRSGTLSKLYFGISSANGKTPAGDVICTVYNGMGSLGLYDAWKDKGPTVADYCANLSTTLIFDGFVGSVSYFHYTNTSGSAVNGIDNLAFINGANVTITGSDIVMAGRGSGAATVYVEDGSSYSGKAIVGTYLDGGAQVNGDAYTVTVGKLNTWNGTEWTTDRYGKGLGAQVRVEAPYGIRFGFVGSTAALEAMLGQAVAEKGVLLIPTALLNGDLDINNANALKVEAKVAYALNLPNQFTAMLVDDRVNSDEAWLDTWADVQFTARAYFELADGSVVYSDKIARSISGVTADILG